MTTIAFSKSENCIFIIVAVILIKWNIKIANKSILKNMVDM